jgi:NADPH:quinone reductase-like Zn-dependent oxidoreductase
LGLDSPPDAVEDQAMSRIIRFHQLGGPELLRVEEIADREPGPGEVRLRVHAFALNRADVQFRRGEYIEQPHLPSRLGYEAAGVVEALGPGVTGLEVGARMSVIPGFSLAAHGTHGESAIVPMRALTAHPAHFSAEQAAALWLSYLTAYGGLAEPPPHSYDGAWVLLTAATGGVGRAAIQVAKAQGARVIATTRSSTKIDSLEAGGADQVVDLSKEDLVGRIDAITSGRGVQLVFDAIAGESTVTLSQVVAPGGVIRLYGYFGGLATPLPLVPFLLKGLTFSSFNVFRLTADQERLAVAKRYILDGIQRGLLAPVIDRIFPLADISAAHRYLESNSQNGKVVVRA